MTTEPLSTWPRYTRTGSTAFGDLRDRVVSFEAALQYPGGMGRAEYLYSLGELYSGDKLRELENEKPKWPLELNYVRKVVDKLSRLVGGQWDLMPSHHRMTIQVGPAANRRERVTWQDVAKRTEDYLMQVMFDDNPGDLSLKQVV